MNKVRIGIVGAGGIAPAHIEAFNNNPYAEVVAICNRNEERARLRAQQYGIPLVYSDYHKLLANSDIDAVSVTTPNSTHAPITIDALNAGKHVLCEKPPAMNAGEAMNMKQAADKNGKLLMYAFVRRFGQNAGVLKEMIDNGDLGTIYYAKTGWLRRCGNPGGWFSNKELAGGGPLIDVGVHILDLAMYLMGKPKPVSVFGTTNNALGNRSNIKGFSWYKAVDFSADKNDVEDFANGLIRFENGASLFIETSWTMHVKEQMVYMDFFGDRGGAKLEPELEIYGEKNNYMVNIRPVLDNYAFNGRQAFAAQINHFIDCIVSKTPCLCPAEDGVTIMKILDAIYESARTGQLITL